MADFCRAIVDELYGKEEVQQFYQEKGLEVPEDASQWLRIFKKSFEFAGVPKLEEYTKFPKKTLKEPEEEFEVVVSHEVIEHFEQPERHVELARSAR